MPVQENLLIWNSAFRSNINENPANCTIHYNNVDFLQGCVSCRLKSATIPARFHNIYGKARTLYIRHAGSVKTVVIPEGTYTTVGALAAAIDAPLQAIVGGDIAGTDSSGKVNFTKTTGDAFDILSLENVITEEKTATISLNWVIGAPITGDINFAAGTDNETLPEDANITGVRKVFIHSDRLAASHCCHPSRNIIDIISSVDLTTTDFGSHAHVEYPDSTTTRVVYRQSRTCMDLDISLYDEHEQVLSLPPNANVCLEFIVTSLGNEH